MGFLLLFITADDHQPIACINEAKVEGDGNSKIVTLLPLGDMKEGTLSMVTDLVREFFSMNQAK